MKIKFNISTSREFEITTEINIWGDSSEQWKLSVKHLIVQSTYEVKSFDDLVNPPFWLDRSAKNSGQGRKLQESCLSGDAEIWNSIDLHISSFPYIKVGRNYSNTCKMLKNNDIHMYRKTIKSWMRKRWTCSWSLEILINWRQL